MGNTQQREARDANQSVTKPKDIFKSSKQSGHYSSSFNGALDPRAKFRNDLQNHSNFGHIPPICSPHRFKFYTWESGMKMGHESIVVASKEPKYGYFTIELVVDEGDDLATVIPETNYISVEKAKDKKYVSNKWKAQFNLETTIDQLINFTIALIDNHGTYSSFHNGCQHLVKDFLEKINGKEYSDALNTALKNNAKYQSALKSKIPCSSSVRLYRESKIKNAVRQEVGGVSYQTVEDTALGLGALAIVPTVACMISKELNDNNARYKVKWRGNEPKNLPGVEEENDEEHT